MANNRSQRSLDIETAFNARLAELGAVLLQTQWLGSNARHKAMCRNGHICYPRPFNVLRQGICKTGACNDRRSIGEQRFIIRLYELGARPLYAIYNGGRMPHKVMCNANHICYVRPTNVNQGQGVCKICAGIDSITADQNFRNHLISLGATPVYVKFCGSKSPHKAICNAGHICYPRPDNVKMGQGICRICVGNIWDVLYVVVNRTEHRIKFGITSGAPKPRLSDHKRRGYAEVARLIEIESAHKLEQIIKIALAACNYEPVRGREYFDIDALPFILYIVDTYMTHGCAPWQLTEVKAE
jgi:hypothetical protein